MGRPNVGKSTLLNRLTGRDLSIITAKPQTTRNRLLGIHTEDDVQAIYVDTPGFHSGKSMLNKRMNQYVLNSIAENDINFWITEPQWHAKDTCIQMDQEILKLIKPYKSKTVLVINKIDKAN